MSLSIVILAAGYGTRMKSKTPKVLHKISGKTMIEHTVTQAQKLSDDVTVVLYFEYEKIQSFLETKFSGINYVVQDVQNYPGTGGAMRNLRYKHEEVLILNGDMPLITDEALQPLLQCDADIVMSVISLQNPHGYGRVVIDNEKVQKIVEQKDCTDAELQINTVNAGVYKVKKEILNEYIPKLRNDNASAEYYLTDIIEAAVADNKKIKPAYVQETYFKGVNSKYDLANAETIMQNAIKKAWMLEGCIMRLPDTIYIEKEVVLKGECIIENNVSILGNSVLENAHIKAGSVIEDAHIVNSSIGPTARIRPDSKIFNSHVGNFVEVKKSTLQGVKAGHLSYLGDSQIDEGTNIGAGVITCNYDGKNKYKTSIGKNVFVGSDTQIIAPCQIEDDTMIAAGTTLTSDVKKGELAISRAAIKKVKNFYYKFFK
jgi:bifunctional UDP-N-acetylglucosamine pyrophosphorylase/glucosamine-1-phosphate N-acetyltransferase